MRKNSVQNMLTEMYRKSLMVKHSKQLKLVEKNIKPVQLLSLLVQNIKKWVFRAKQNLVDVE